MLVVGVLNKKYNRAHKAMMVIHCMSAMGPDLRIGQMRGYLDKQEFSSGRTGSGGNLYAVLAILLKAKLVDRYRHDLPITNRNRKKKPQVYLYNLTAIGHRSSFGNEEDLRQIMEEVGLRAERQPEPVPVPRAERKGTHANCFQFLMMTVDRGVYADWARGQRRGPIEIHFNGHHYYDPYKSRYID